MLKEILRRGSHLALPSGWRNSFSIQRASERNVCERAISPYFQTPISPYFQNPNSLI